MKKLFIILLGIIPTLFSCSHVDKKDVSSVTNFINEESNALKQVKEVEKVKYSLTYRPTVLMVNQEVGQGNDKQSKLKAYQKYSPYYYFILNLSIADKDALYKGSNSQAQFSENIQKFSFQMGDYVYAIDTDDTVRLADFYTPNMYGYAKSTEVLLVFDRSQIKGDQFKINVEELGLGIGRQTFEFNKKDLEEIDH